MLSSIKACVQAVYNLCTQPSKNCVHLPTAIQKVLVRHVSAWVQLAVSTQTTHPKPTTLSTAFFNKTPLFEHNLYPVSTGPTIIITKEIN